MMEVVIRAVTARDYDALCAIIDEADRLHRERLPHLFQQASGTVREREYILALIADEDHGLFLAEAEGQVVGFAHAVIRHTPPVPIVVPRRLAMVDNLVVKEECRRAGIGRALMAHVHRWALDRGATEVELTVYDFNKAAKALYRSLGYEVVSHHMSRRLA
jgi:ribosomal protein S18 acetylase RimI-like enzyme